MKLSTDGIVLRDYKIEDDRILTLLTRDYGVITAYAGGANRMRSRLAGSTELLCYSHLVLFKSRDRHSVDKADSIRSFFGLRSDLERLALGSYFAALAADVSPEHEPAEAYLKLLLNTLHYLEEGRSLPQLKALYELRILTLGGYMPNLVACRGCGAFESPTMYFSPQQGDLLCQSCAQSAASGIPVGGGVLAAMRHIIYCETEKLFSFTLSDSGLKSLAGLSEQYLKYQLEKTFPTLEFYHSLSLTLGP